MRDDFGQQKVRRLAHAGVVEGPHDGDGQARHPQAGHVLHRQFADGVVVGRLRRGAFVQHAAGLVAVDVGAAGQQHARGRLGQLRQHGQQVACAQQIDAVEGVGIRIGIAVPDKGDGRQVDHGLRARLGHGVREGGAVGQIRLLAQSANFPAALR